MMTTRFAFRLGRLIILSAAALAVALQAAQVPRPERIVSLIPAVTEMIFAIGAGNRVIATSSYDRYPPEVTRLVKVGGLLDPDVERILALRPDLVIAYATQQELKQRLARAAVPVFSYEHRGLADVPETIRAIGAQLGERKRADDLVSEIERDIRGVRASVAAFARPRTMIVFGREPGSLRNIEASGGYGFLHDMLEVAGGVNVFADIQRQSVQVGTEMVLARRPDVIIELRYGDSARSLDVARELEAWRALASVPAIKNNRVHVLVGDEFVVPGPRVVSAMQQFADALHPERTKPQR